MIAYVAVILIGLEILSEIVPILFRSFDKIPIRGKHLDKLETLDNAFVYCNKFLTVIFVYHVIQVTYATPTINWNMDEITLANTVGSLIAFYIFYDFFYMWFHRILHIRGLYAYIHKHHHRQKAPSRGNIDAINVHPFEFVVGEYLHLLTIYMIPCHIVAVAIFILLGGILASLNHTRLDVIVPPGIYSVKVHDVHHRIPDTNYAQYTMFWDRLHGTYREYDATPAKDD